MRRTIVTVTLLAVVFACLAVGAVVLRQRRNDQQPLLAFHAGQLAAPSASLGGDLDSTGLWRRYLAAVSAFNKAELLPSKPVAAKLDAAAAAQQAVNTALAAKPPVHLRSQLMNLAAILLEITASKDPQAASSEKKQAAGLLQQAIALDETNSDAKFNLELLMQTSPSSASQDKSKPTQKKPTKPKKRKTGRPHNSKPQPIGEGY